MNDSFYSRGVAIGQADIREDSIVFRFKRDIYVVPTTEASEFSLFRDAGHFAHYEAKIGKLRKWAECAGVIIEKTKNQGEEHG